MVCVPRQWQAIIWTNAWTLLIGPLGTTYNSFILEDAFERVVCEMVAIFLVLSVLSTLSPWFLFEPTARVADEISTK